MQTIKLTHKEIVTILVGMSEFSSMVEERGMKSCLYPYLETSRSLEEKFRQLSWKEHCEKIDSSE